MAENREIAPTVDGLAELEKIQREEQRQKKADAVVRRTSSKITFFTLSFLLTAMIFFNADSLLGAMQLRSLYTIPGLITVIALFIWSWWYLVFPRWAYVLLLPVLCSIMTEPLNIFAGWGSLLLLVMLWPFLLMAYFIFLLWHVWRAYKSSQRQYRLHVAGAACLLLVLIALYFESITGFTFSIIIIILALFYATWDANKYPSEGKHNWLPVAIWGCCVLVAIYIFAGVFLSARFEMNNNASVSLSGRYYVLNTDWGWLGDPDTLSLYECNAIALFCQKVYAEQTSSREPDLREAFLEIDGQTGTLSVMRGSRTLYTHPTN